MTYHRPTQAFTLIELMISIALGTLILYTAFAGFRTASQAITISNGLSLENSLLRAGYFQVQNDLDFWTSVDDPNNTANQLLRGPLLQSGKVIPSPYAFAGNPFTPMHALWAANLPPGTVATQRFSSSSIVPGSPTTYGEIKPRPSSTYVSGQATTVDPWEGDIGFDPSLSYSASDPRTWCRVNLAEKNLAYNGPSWNTNPLDPNFGKQTGWGTTPLPYGPFVPPVMFGRYGLFSNIATNPTYGSWQIGWNLTFIGQAYTLPNAGSTPPPPPPPQDVPYMVSYNAPTAVVHTWYANQIQTFLALLGYHAMAEYLPPNAIYNYYVSQPSGMTGLQYASQPSYAYTPTGGHEPSNEWDWSTPCSAGGMARICTQPGWGANSGFRNWDGNQITSAGIYRQTYSTSFGYFNPWAPPDLSGEPGVFIRHYMRYNTDYTAYGEGGGTIASGGARSLQDLLTHSAYRQTMLPQKPANWPDVSTAVGRLVKNDHFVAVAKIRRINPLTGAITELSFVGLGTTLRGARMQRQPTSGWASWDDNPSTITNNSPNLDSPTATTPP